MILYPLYLLQVPEVLTFISATCPCYLILLFRQVRQQAVSATLALKQLKLIVHIVFPCLSVWRFAYQVHLDVFCVFDY